MDEAGKVSGSPVITGSEAPEVFELVEATLNSVALFVGVGVVRNDERFDGITAVAPARR